MEHIITPADYATSLQQFIEQHNLPQEWFDNPDHVAVKARDSEHFGELIGEVKAVRGDAEISCIDIDGRRLASTRLIEPLEVLGFGNVWWVEIMEPRPEKVGKDIVGFEHMEFNFPNFESARKVLDEKEIVYEMQSNPSHAWINIVINEQCQELKLNNTPLATMVADEQRRGVLYFL